VILAGDIGGTNTRLALFGAEVGAPAAIEMYRSRDHAGLDVMVQDFLSHHAGEVTSATFAVAGPVRGGRAEMTNLAWPVEAARISEAVGIPHVSLLNDLHANARGIEALGPDDFASVNDGEAGATGNAAVVSAGTGLGQAGLYWDGERHHAFAAEGGHTDFAPRNELEDGLRQFLAADYPHVSYERVCSGIGLVNIHRYLAGPDAETEALDGVEITRRALDRSDPVCVQAIDLMVSIYGAQAGNVALTLMATGGVYLGGGIAPVILSKLREGGFMDAFKDKGRLGELLDRIPVRVILNEQTALLGAALDAAERARTLA
jgi:glucokinase